MDKAGPQPALRRRNSIATSVVIPSELAIPSKPLHTSSLPPHHTNGNGVASSPPLDFELSSFKSSLSYTSLKDILPSTAVNSPTGAASACGSACEISIRNRLVKQAAWAYLQPMSSSPDSSSQHFLRRLWLQFSVRNPITSCIRFISLHVIPSITRTFDRILRAIRVRMDR
ncbi:hypothetical protein P3X46_009458 [Hevea brasiliensis]|uniref:COPII coat assembly protein SEC16 n=1 Tax=Hevea brasiliensis TaxID=3981 RepID=A0ABQ9MPL4_HEVBR|nr:uncharacterized protein LOC110632026 [Hevea brasiliensis]KAJ9181318.1 hypothetical protein P3X46_009458 [Hevea brasiliensis]